MSFQRRIKKWDGNKGDLRGERKGNRAIQDRAITNVPPPSRDTFDERRWRLGRLRLFFTISEMAKWSWMENKHEKSVRASDSRARRERNGETWNIIYPV